MKNKNRSRIPMIALGILFVSLGCLTGAQAIGLSPAARTNAASNGTSAQFYEPFANNSARWTLENEWQIGPAMVSPVADWNPDPGMDTTPTADNGVAGIVIGGNASTALHDYEYLTSPVINTDVGGQTVTLTFNRWLNSDFAPFMQNDIEVWNGTSWIKIFETGGQPSVTDSIWMPQQFDLTPYQNASMQVRFGMRVMSGGAFTVSSWNIDDLTIAPVVASSGVGPPTNKNQCKNGGWQTFTIPRTFKNQGDCVSFVNNGR